MSFTHAVKALPTPYRLPLKHGVSAALAEAVHSTLSTPTDASKEAVVDAAINIVAEATVGIQEPRRTSEIEQTAFDGPQELANYFAKNAAQADESPAYKMGRVFELRAADIEEVANVFVEITPSGDKKKAWALLAGKITPAAYKRLIDDSYSMTVALKVGDTTSEGDVSDVMVIELTPTGAKTDYQPKKASKATIIESSSDTAYSRFRRAYHETTGKLLPSNPFITERKVIHDQADPDLVKIAAEAAHWRPTSNPSTYKHTGSELRIRLDGSKLSLSNAAVEEAVVDEAVSTWYHGDPIKRTSFAGQKMDRDRRSEQGGNENGPGIYWTSEREEAQHYGSWIHTATMKTIKARILTDRIKATPTLVSNLIDAAAQERRESALLNWAETPGAALPLAVASYVGMRTFADAAVAIYRDIFGYDADAWADAMTSIGFDAYQPADRPHFIVYNPKIIADVKAQAKADESQQVNEEDAFVRYLVPRKSVLINNQWWTIAGRAIENDKVVLKLSEFALKDGVKPQKPKLMKWSKLLADIKGGKIGARIGDKYYGPKQDRSDRADQRKAAGVRKAPGTPKAESLEEGVEYIITLKDNRVLKAKLKGGTFQTAKGTLDTDDDSIQQIVTANQGIKT